MSGTALVQAIVDGVLTGGVYALMAAGLSLIFGVMDIVNIAQGAMVVLAGYLSYSLSVHLGIDLLLSLLITVPAMFTLGVAVEWCFMRRLRAAPGLLRRQLGARARLLPALHLPDRLWHGGGPDHRPLRDALPHQVRPRGAGVAAEPHGGRPDRHPRQPRADDLGRHRRLGDGVRGDGLRGHQRLQPRERL